jgi:uncharacterized delta-60 repeat protein
MKLSLFKKILSVVLASTFLLSFNILPAWAADGDLDTSFDTDGIAITEIGISAAEAHSLVMQSDGKIVAAGYMNQDVSPGKNIFAVVRYNTDGSLDTTFSGDGIQTTAIGLFNSEAWDIVVQSDGKIVVVGHTQQPDRSSTFAVVRYDTDGTLDSSFSVDGIVKTDVASGDEEAYSVVLQSDGKIVVAGYSNNGSDNDFAVVRYNTDGSLDNTFSGDGIQTTDIGDSEAESVVLQSDGKIIVAGTSTVSGDFAVVRYNTDGSLDTTFSGDGIQTTDFGASDNANSVVVQSDGKIVVAGKNSTRIAVARYNTDGSLDITFDTDGKQSTAIANEANGQEVILQSDGKIVVAGFIRTVIGIGRADNNDFAVVRYNTDGSLDTTFSGDGIQTTRIDQIPPDLTEPFSPYDRAYSVVLQSDGKIVVAGTSYEYELDFAVVRYSTSISSTSISSSSWVGAQSISCPSPNPWVKEKLGFASNAKPVLVSAENTIGKTITQGSYDALRSSGVVFDTVSTKVSTATETLPIYGCKDKLLSGKVNQPIQFIAGGYTLQTDAHGYINTADLKWHDTNSVTLYTNTAAFMHTVKFTNPGKYVVVLTEQPDTSRGLIPTYGVRSVRFVINID